MRVLHPIPYKIAKEAIEIFESGLDQFPRREVNRTPITLYQCNKGKSFMSRILMSGTAADFGKAVEEKLAQNGLKRKEENSHL